jgi:hypothetical protein
MTPPCTPAHGTSSTQCFKLGFTPVNAVATGDRADSGGPFQNGIGIQIPASGFQDFIGGCPANYLAAAASSYNVGDGTGQPGGFFIVFN